MMCCQELPLVNDCHLGAEFCTVIRQRPALDSILAWFSDFPTPLTSDALNEGDPLERVHIWCRKTRIAGLQYGEGRMMISSVVWAQYINVTDTQHNSLQTDRQPRRHSKCRPAHLP